MILGYYLVLATEELMADDEAVIVEDGLDPDNIDDVYVPYVQIEDDTIEKDKPEIEFDENVSTFNRRLRG